jgi:tetratricopeptide (TPR) repeat protein
MKLSKPKMRLALAVVIAAVVSSSAWAVSLDDRVALYDSYTLEGQGLITKAIEKVTGVLSRNQTDYFVNYRLGWLFFLEKKYKNSIEHYQKAANLVPTSIEPWLGASYVYVMTGDYSNSVRTCAEALKRDPQNYTCLQRTTLSLIRLKDYSGAIEKANISLKLYPTDLVFLEQKVFALKESGHADEAKDIASALITLSPRNVYAKRVLAGG